MNRVAIFAASLLTAAALHTVTAAQTPRPPAGIPAEELERVGAPYTPD